MKTDFKRPIIIKMLFLLIMLFHDTNKVLWSALPWAMLIINAQMLQTYENLFVFIFFSNLVYQEIISC